MSVNVPRCNAQIKSIVKLIDTGRDAETTQTRALSNAHTEACRQTASKDRAHSNTDATTNKITDTNTNINTSTNNKHKHTYTRAHKIRLTTQLEYTLAQRELVPKPCLLVGLPCDVRLCNFQAG